MKEEIKLTITDYGVCYTFNAGDYPVKQVSQTGKKKQYKTIKDNYNLYFFSSLLCSFISICFTIWYIGKYGKSIASYK